MIEDGAKSERQIALAIGFAQERQLGLVLRRNGHFGIPGGEQNLEVGAAFPCFAGEHVTRQLSAHDDVAEEKINPFRSLKDRKGGFSVGHFAHAVTKVDELNDRHLAEVGVVFGDEDDLAASRKPALIGL